MMRHEILASEAASVERAGGQRERWQFGCRVSTLLRAARAKQRHHAARLRHWKAALRKAETQFKAKGISIQANSPQVSGYGPKATIDDRMQRAVQEAMWKIEEHTRKAADFEAWVAFLSNWEASETLAVTKDDLVFFGLLPDDE